MKKPTFNQYRATAKALYYKEGELEFDFKAKVSKGNEEGAYVQGWIWVSDEDVRLWHPMKDRLTLRT